MPSTLFSWFPGEARHVVETRPERDCLLPCALPHAEEVCEFVRDCPLPGFAKNREVCQTVYLYYLQLRPEWHPERDWRGWAWACFLLAARQVNGDEPPQDGELLDRGVDPLDLKKMTARAWQALLDRDFRCLVVPPCTFFFSLMHLAAPDTPRKMLAVGLLVTDRLLQVSTLLPEPTTSFDVAVAAARVCLVSPADRARLPPSVSAPLDDAAAHAYAAVLRPGQRLSLTDVTPTAELRFERVSLLGRRPRKRPAEPSEEAARPRAWYDAVVLRRPAELILGTKKSSRAAPLVLHKRLKQQ